LTRPHDTHLTLIKFSRQNQGVCDQINSRLYALLSSPVACFAT
jgi:hypothetical protein